MLKILKWFFMGTFGAVGFLLASAWTSMGKMPTDEELKSFQQSPQWQGQRFKNNLSQEPVDRWQASKRFFFSDNPYAKPQQALEFKPTNTEIYQQVPNSGLRVTWLGHSSLLLEVDGSRFLVDPVWGERASPFGFMGAKRFYPMPLAIEDLPKIDAILISHDHYDHLDLETVERFKDREIPWYVPLGVGAHLRYWGVDSSKVHEMDWWQGAVVNSVKITAIPSRHTSGRSMSDQKKTLWSGWALNGPINSVVYSGDTSMHKDFSTIGERLGPFDLSIIEIGAYNPLWRDNHLGPEQALLAHKLLKAKAMLPVHWAGFDLSTHGWTEPMERLKQAADNDKDRPLVLSPVPGVPFELSQSVSQTLWWPAIPWQTAEQNPVWSSKVEALLKPAAN